MPAIILPFVRPTDSGSERGHEAAVQPDAPRQPARPLDTLPTPRQIAHRRAMLSHLTRHRAWRRSEATPEGVLPPEPLR
jgi:hypothetical protein